jgi:Tfp pilus assembly protein FimT
MPPGLPRPRSAQGTSVCRGWSAIELVIVLGIAGVLFAVVIPPMRKVVHRIAVQGAAVDAMTAFALARNLAIARGTRVAVMIDEPHGILRVTARGDTTIRALGDVHGITLEATRDSMAYTPIGLGLGGSNLRLILRRGRAAETLYVSRLGRVRR